MKEILAMMTNLCQKMEKIEKDVQVLKETVNSQQHDLKYAELSQQHDLKNAELEGDDGKHLKTQNKKIYTSAGSSATTGSTATAGPSTKKEEAKNPRAKDTKNPNEDYITQYLQGYNKLIAQPGTNPNLVATCYNYGLLSTVYTITGEEVSKIPELYKAFLQYKRVTKGTLFYIKFYSATAEILYDEIKPTIQAIEIGLTREMIIPEKIDTQEEIQKVDIPEFYANKRTIGIATI
ncbi:uncharacterized protein LOC107013307 [Solanum pennellii]|uniref:Uncharacterized protein LOC107013307 n=1 Tax=Solanum pennellii TaxID=28526 RepID=A0ABM1GBL8_SOLPN|nr:uncharacterized protein LOC107013307 [Solanum pennellii]